MILKLGTPTAGGFPFRESAPPRGEGCRGRGPAFEAPCPCSALQRTSGASAREPRRKGRLQLALVQQRGFGGCHLTGCRGVAVGIGDPVRMVHRMEGTIRRGPDPQVPIHFVGNRNVVVDVLVAFVVARGSRPSRIRRREPRARPRWRGKLRGMTLNAALRRCSRCSRFSPKRGTESRRVAKSRP